MVKAFERRHSLRKSLSFNFKKMFDRQSHSEIDCGGEVDAMSHNSTKSVAENPLVLADIVPAFKSPLPRMDGVGNKANNVKGNSDMELMKERFAKLLLGEDMSGGGKGVSSALTLSNAITNLAASIFGESHKLEPMSPERKARWRKEIGWLLSVTDHIVEFVPSQQTLKDGTKVEVMVTRQRTDLHMNIPALRKLDAMLLDCLDQFANQQEFWYVSADDENSDIGSTPRNDEKWWLPTPKVPPEGLSDMAKKFLHFQKESVNQVLKAAMAINAQVLAEMEIPESYIESLPKNGRSSLGELVYKSITDEYFDPAQFLATLDLTSEHKVLDLKNRIEASIVIWKRKLHGKDNKSSWGSAVSLGKRELFEERAETILLLLKQRFPGLPQSALDISKIQYNMDVGQAILESYSRVLESLASTVMSRIEDVLYADALTQNSPMADCNGKPPPSPTIGQNTFPSPPQEVTPATTPPEVTPIGTPNSKTLSEFMGWFDNEESDIKKHMSAGSLDKLSKDENEKTMNKPANIKTKKFSYLEKLENISGLRSPTARH